MYVLKSSSMSLDWLKVGNGIVRKEKGIKYAFGFIGCLFFCKSGKAGVTRFGLLQVSAGEAGVGTETHINPLTLHEIVLMLMTAFLRREDS